MANININLLAGGVSGFLAIALGAYATHVLKISISEDDFGIVIKAIDYQQLHAAMLVLVGVANLAPLSAIVRQRLRFAGYLFMLGTIQFCGGIYVGVLTSLHMALKIVPMGGGVFMVGWLFLASAAFTPRAD